MPRKCSFAERSPLYAIAREKCRFRAVENLKSGTIETIFYSIDIAAIQYVAIDFINDSWLIIFKH